MIDKKKQTMPHRPVVYDYRSVSAFLSALYVFNKRANPRLSIRKRLRSLKNPCSPALVSQVLSGKRKIKRDKLPIFAEFFELSEKEFSYLDTLLRGDLVELPRLPTQAARPPKREYKNSILKSWLNPYIKDLASLRGFQPNAHSVFSMLNGIAKPKQIEQSLKFLFHEGYLKKTTDKEVTVDENVVFSSNDIPNEKIKTFHKKALQIAVQGISTYPINERKSSTVLISVDDEHTEQLNQLLDSFQHQLAEFIEAHPKGRDKLVQVCLHMTPVGVHNEK